MVVIKEIEPDSLGERSGFRIGDRLLRINGEEVRDLIDFQVMSAEESLEVEIERGEELYEATIERKPGEAFGLGFEDIRLRSCNNKCVFCLDGFPKGDENVYGSYQGRGGIELNSFWKRLVFAWQQLDINILLTS